MPKPKQDLTKRQEGAVKRFVRAQKDLVRGTDRLHRDRLRALKSALDAGVYGTVLAERSGLAQSRVYQLQDQIKKKETKK